MDLLSFKGDLSIIYEFDGIPLRLKSVQNFDFLHRFGKAFWGLDETGSGCVCLGLQDEAGCRYFVKVAGADTIFAELSREESITLLRRAVSIYKELNHDNLIRFVDDFAEGDLYCTLFRWADGDCLFDHWNFDRYESAKTLRPKDRFFALPKEKKLKVADELFSFLDFVHQKGYTAVDFYDGSILYDFECDNVTFCDVDLFRKGAVRNDKGEGWPGTKRLKAPEEYKLGAAIDRRTNVFTLGALLFEFFGEFSPEEIAARYRENRFSPCPFSRWQLNKESYLAAKKAVSIDPAERFETMAEFLAAWQKALL